MTAAAGRRNRQIAPGGIDQLTDKTATERTDSHES
jgi:hypothetical protein